jgi:prevent-host-death family protein
VLSAWRLEEATARFGEVVRLAREAGPQHVSVRGRAAVVVLSAEEYARLSRRRRQRWPRCSAPARDARSDPVAPAGARGWLLDTNVISELRKGARCDRAVAAWGSVFRRSHASSAG